MKKDLKLDVMISDYMLRVLKYGGLGVYMGMIFLADSDGVVRLPKRIIYKRLGISNLKFNEYMEDFKRIHLVKEVKEGTKTLYQIKWKN